MPWNARHDPQHNVIETVYAGILTPPELLEAAKTTLELAVTHNCPKFLGDCSQLLGGHSIFDLYGLLDLLEATGFHRDWKEALLFPQAVNSNAIEDVRFWETACKNRGFMVTLFADRDAALRWLTE